MKKKPKIKRTKLKGTKTRSTSVLSDGGKKLLQQSSKRGSEGKSRVTNGKTLFLDAVDGRSVVARRFKDVLYMIIEDLGGKEFCSEAQKQLARRAATLSVESEKIEADFVKERDPDESVQLDRYMKITNSLNRVFKTLGIERRKRKKDTDIKSYLEDKKEAEM